MARRYAATDEVSVSDDLSTTGSAGGNVRFLPRRWSSMGKGEIACVRYVRKHLIRLAALSTFSSRRRLEGAVHRHMAMQDSIRGGPCPLGLPRVSNILKPSIIRAAREGFQGGAAAQKPSRLGRALRYLMFFTVRRAYVLPHPPLTGRRRRGGRHAPSRRRGARRPPPAAGRRASRRRHTASPARRRRVRRRPRAPAHRARRAC